MPMPKGRPETPQHTKSYIVVGLAQGFVLTLSIFLLVGVGL
jgi:hypothetical protein